MRLLGVLMEAVERAEGVEDAGLPAGGPDAFRFADDPLLGQLLRAVGLEGSSVVSIGFEQRVGGTDELWEGLLGGSVRTAVVIERQPELVRRRVRAELERAVAPYRRDDGIVLPVAAKLASAWRP
jgi:hypothetical protein